MKISWFNMASSHSMPTEESGQRMVVLRALGWATTVVNPVFAEENEMGRLSALKSIHRSIVAGSG